MDTLNCCRVSGPTRSAMEATAFTLSEVLSKTRTGRKKRIPSGDVPRKPDSSELQAGRFVGLN
jgi:hypothetical protein